MPRPVARPETTKPAAKAPRKPAAKAVEAPAGRRKSKLTQAGEAAQRGLLLATLKECGWNLTATAEALEMGDPSAVLRSIKVLGLDEEYEAAKARGAISPGSRRA